MRCDYDVIVIGAGIGGLSAASLLSHAGFRTLVLEKNNFLGGRCASYRKNDCLIDAFIHMFARCEGGPYGEILRRAEMPDAIRFWHTDPGNKPVLFLHGKPCV
jgi:prolycopene isomerase